MQDKSFSIAARLKAFSYAFNGIVNFVKYEHNAWLHFIATVAIVAFSFYMKISGAEWIAILLCIGFVWAMELINTAIEKIMDHLHPEMHLNVKLIKDMAAGAVLIAAIISFIIALIIFIPKFL
ncbi:diacylglycerol kinase family protein [Pinibacter aurantiacus]|uniref:Diacylglycerol kinase family protein n=1 Tax=Pinibacter aurantiacus TaxID=2851599 RepID=A0A9E2W7P5_9BACT|nr:diacylglycerol kinase family protein [Pinibacter aurantiacus]MBV4356642.1 diacylglycerol kinase family protein [Pinibacter aurantiacus]